MTRMPATMNVTSRAAESAEAESPADAGAGGGGGNALGGGRGGGGGGDATSCCLTVAAGVFWMVTPAPLLTAANQSLCMVAGGVELIVLATDVASAALRMTSVASTLTLAAETRSVTSSASANRARSAVRKPVRSNEATSPATLKVVRTTGL